MTWNWFKERSKWVAEYCTICRDVQPHCLVFMRDEKSRLPVYFVDCSVCSLRRSTEPTRYQSAVFDLPRNILELVNLTFPRLPLEVAGRVAWEKDAIGQKLQGPERLQAIREPFIALAHLANGGPGIGVFLFLSVLFGILSFIPTTITSVLVSARYQETVLMVGGTIGFVLAVALAGFIVLRRRLLTGKKVIGPMISRSLRPLRPSAEELRDVLNWAQMMNQPIGAQFSAEELFDSVSRQPDRSLIHADEMNLIAIAQRMYAELNPQPDGTDSTATQPPESDDRFQG